MRTTSVAALLVAFAVPALAEDVLMLEHTPTVEELRSYLAPDEAVRRTRGIEIVGQQVLTAQAPQMQQVSTMPPEQQPEPEPKTKPRVKAMPEPTTIGYRVQFAYDSAELTADAKPFLDQLGQVLQSEPSLSLAVEGHTDGHGSDVYNIALSQRRAQAVQAYLAEAWEIQAGRLTVLGKGESEPLTSDPMAAENRRVQFRPLGS